MNIIIILKRNNELRHFENIIKVFLNKKSKITILRYALDEKSQGFKAYLSIKNLNFKNKKIKKKNTFYKFL